MRPPVIDELVFKKKDIDGEWEIHARYEYEWFQADDFSGYVRFDKRIKIFLNGEAKMPDQIHADDLDEIERLTERGWRYEPQRI